MRLPSINLIVLMGLQGSGKTSFRKNYLPHDLQVVSKDLMKNKKHKQLRQERLIREYLSEGKSVVVDNMNLTKENRRSLLGLAREYSAKCILYFFPISLEESFLRNEGLGRHKVPSVAIHSAVKSFEWPGDDEGFDDVYNVRMITPVKFEIGHRRKVS